MCGGTSDQQDILDLQKQFYQQTMDESGAVYGMDSALFKEITGALEPIFAKGPSQEGFSKAETNALNTQATEGVAQNYKQASQALREEEAAQGGGNESIPSGQSAELSAELAGEAAATRSSEESQITEASYQQGQQDWESAMQGMLNAGAVMSGGAQYGQMATGAGSAASTTANDIAQANASVFGSVMGAAGAVVGAACPVKGSTYLMADGSEKLVEALQVGDLIMGIDDEAETIEEIQSSLTPIVRTVTEDGHALGSSPTHAFALPRGGFAVAAKALGKPILTSKGSSKVVEVNLAGEDWVFNVISNGSHTYRVNGIWSLGVGEAERHIGMNQWALIGSRITEPLRRASNGVRS